MEPADILKLISEDGELHISIMLTEQCNFKCRHCCFDSGSHKPRGYVSNEVLDRLLEISDIVRGLGGYVDFNLIGGEPTLNMREFKRCLAKLASSGDRMTMVTNGWWFGHPHWCYQFFDAVIPHTYDEMFHISISNDQFHDEWRKFELSELDYFLKDLDGHAGICRCGCLDYGDFCPECGEELLRVPDAQDWIFVQCRSNTVYPIGRGQGHGNMDRVWLGDCMLGTNLVFYPDGTLSDACCIGAQQRFGTVWDHPLSLLGLARRFTEEMTPTCWDCEEQAIYWIGNGLQEAREYWTGIDWEAEWEKL